jgi:hypothetical protein
MNNIKELNFLLAKRKVPKINIIDKIILKFPQMKDYRHIKNTISLDRGTIIRYVSYDLTKLSPSGIIYDIIHDYDVNGKQIVKSLKLMNTNIYPHIFWKINVVKYYIFESTGLQQYGSGLRDYCSNMLTNDEIITEESEQKYDENDYILDQIKKYKNIED